MAPGFLNGWIVDSIISLIESDSILLTKRCCRYLTIYTIVLLIGLPMIILIFRGRGWDFWFNGTLSLGESNIKMSNCHCPFGTAFFRTGDILLILFNIIMLSNIVSRVLIYDWHHYQMFLFLIIVCIIIGT